MRDLHQSQFKLPLKFTGLPEEALYWLMNSNSSKLSQVVFEDALVCLNHRTPWRGSSMMYLFDNEETSSFVLWSVIVSKMLWTFSLYMLKYPFACFLLLGDVTSILGSYTLLLVSWEFFVFFVLFWECYYEYTNGCYLLEDGWWMIDI